MKLLFLVYFIFQIETSVDAQIKDFKKKNVNPKTLSSQKIAALKIGDQIPIVILDNLINYSSKKVKLSDFDNKKLLIIDFWNTRCIACIEAFPKLMSLQKEFKEKLQILLVSDESISTVQAFLKKRHQLADLLMTLPIVCSDKILQKLFKHESCPHCVWIDELGVVKYITYSFDVGKKNITAVLNNEPVAMSLKDDYDEVPYDPVKPLFIKSYAGDGEQLLWYTALSRNIKGMPEVFGIAKDTDRSIALIYNFPIKAIYQFAYNDIPAKGCYVPDNRTILQVKDTSKYVWEIDSVFQWNNRWCYQLITPTMPDTQLIKIMQTDIQRYFHLTAKMEKRKTMCWVLTAEDTLLIKSMGGKIVNDFNIKNFKLTIVNEPIIEMRIRFIYHLLGRSPFPFVDETRFSGNVDITLENINMNDTDSIIKSLKKYKMNLHLEERNVDMLVIKDCD